MRPEKDKKDLLFLIKCVGFEPFYKAGPVIL